LSPIVITKLSSGAKRPAVIKQLQKVGRPSFCKYESASRQLIAPLDSLPSRSIWAVIAPIPGKHAT